jgi:hypothetical protein
MRPPRAAPVFRACPGSAETFAYRVLGIANELCGGATTIVAVPPPSGTLARRAFDHRKYSREWGTIMPRHHPGHAMDFTASWTGSFNDRLSILKADT